MLFVGMTFTVAHGAWLFVIHAEVSHPHFLFLSLNMTEHHTSSACRVFFPVVSPATRNAPIIEVIR